MDKMKRKIIILNFIFSFFLTQNFWSYSYASTQQNNLALRSGVNSTELQTFIAQYLYEKTNLYSILGNEEISQEELQKIHEELDRLQSLFSVQIPTINTLKLYIIQVLPFTNWLLLNFITNSTKKSYVFLKDKDGRRLFRLYLLTKLLKNNLPFKIKMIK